MQLYEDLKYVGRNRKLSISGDTPWHCTNILRRANSEKIEFAIQQPLYYKGVFLGYSNLDVYVFTEDEVIKDFKLIKENGNLEAIVPRKDNKQLEENKKELMNMLGNMTDKEFNSIGGGNN